MLIKFIQECLPTVESFFVIFGIIFIVVQIILQKVASCADHDRRKKQSTIEFYNSLSTKSYQFLDSIRGKTLDLATINSDKELKKNIIRYLSRLERLAVGVTSKVFDFDFLRLMSGRYLPQIYNQLKAFIEDARTNANEPMRFMEFELLVKRIVEDRKKYPYKTVDRSLHVKQP